MKIFFKKKWAKVLLFIFGVIILIVLLWYFFGDVLVFAYLKQSSRWGDYCHEDCVFTREIAKQSLVYLANHRPWLKNKILNIVLNQNQTGGYRVIILDVYETLIGKGNPMPDKLISLVKDTKTPPELKSAIIYEARNNGQSLCVSGLADEWRKIAFDTKEDWTVRDQATEKLTRCQGENAVPLLIQLINSNKNNSVGLNAAQGLTNIFRNKALKTDLVNELEQIVYDKTIHPDIREQILDVFYVSSDKESAKKFLEEIYKQENKENLILVYFTTHYLNSLTGYKKYDEIEFTDMESIKLDNNGIPHSGEAWYPSEEEWLKKVFPDRYVY